MKLMTKELEKKFEKYPLYSQEGLGGSAIVIAKFFNPVGVGTWLITEGNKLDNGDYEMFGYCHLGDDTTAELGYIMLSDLENLNLPYNLKIERDMYFPKNMTLLQAIEKSGIRPPNFMINKCNTNSDNELEEADIIPCQKLEEGWNWHQYNDGSGHLQSPDGKKYMSYDLCTNEYQITEDSEYDFFPLSYYYADGFDPLEFKPFEFMEQKMIDYVLPKEREKEKLLNNKIKILRTWLTDYDDMRCNAILMEDNREVANIITGYDECDLRYSIGNKDSEMDEDFIKKAFQTLIYDNFKSYLELPKISKCSKLLQEIYDNVCESDATMCHISDEDWNDYYIDNYSDSDIDVLKDEIKKYGLDEVIGIEDGEYKIVGYGDLETKFNDDRNLQKYIIKNLQIQNMSGHVMIYYGELESGEWYLHSDLGDSIVIYNKKPLEKDYYDDEYSWHNNHLIAEIQNKDAKEMFRKMNSLIDDFVSEPNWNKSLHQHFQDMIDMGNHEELEENLNEIQRG